MNAVYLSDSDVIDFTPAADTEAGVFVTIGSIVGITKSPIKAGHLGTITTRGVFSNVPKYNISNAFTAGQKVWLNPSNGLLYNASSADYICVGYALSASGATDKTCSLLLSPTGEVGSAQSSTT